MGLEPCVEVSVDRSEAGFWHATVSIHNAGYEGGLWTHTIDTFTDDPRGERYATEAAARLVGDLSHLIRMLRIQGGGK